ncbi:MAG: septum formation initiator family protein [Candidatus Colwellbacteria bacterium]|nr:septum formation initiator family protein [Candidatus Colwellbacteria bacterium]
MRIVVYIVFGAVSAIILYHLYGANLERLELKERYSASMEELGELKTDIEGLESDIEYYSDPRNLEKEMRARFNYRAPNEKTIIVVPEESNDATE